MDLFNRTVLLSGCLMGLSPVLKTLTSTYSTDTVWALTISLCILHVVFHDYSYMIRVRPASPQRYQGHLSLNAAIFASVVLASQFALTMQVFAFELFAFELFAGFPILARQLRRRSLQAYKWLTVCMVVAIAWFLAQLGTPIITYAYVVGIVFISFVGPFFLKLVQRYKNEIRGPWDYDDEAEGLG